MRRKLLTFASALSLLLFAATAALWIRSYRIYDDLQIRQMWDPSPSVFSSRDGAFNSIGGRILFGFAQIDLDLRFPADIFYKEGPDAALKHVREMPRETEWTHGRSDAQSNPASLYANSLGFRFNREFRSTPGRRYRRWQIVFPDWFVLGISAVLPLIWIYRRRRQRRLTFRRLHNLCLNCGYDMCATLSRCPECGVEARVSPDGAGR